ncbi:MAG TPA: AIPR family protein, partial [Clostridium sp.]
IIRMNQINDAFVLLVAKTIFENHIKNKKKIFGCIVPPPDEGIDIFLEQEDDDEEYTYHISQVKNEKLTQVEIINCFSYMKRTMDNYNKKPEVINKNLKEIINKTNFGISKNNKCVYYVIHTGNVNCIKGQKNDEKIINEINLTTLLNSIVYECVPKEEIQVDKFNNHIFYEPKEESVGNENKQPKAYMCNLNGYDLAQLNNKYSSTEIGRNILYNLNFRDSLGKKSKTFEPMLKTVDNVPENFWLFNNGISIITEEFIDPVDGKDTICLKNFSIINGAQTTSTLGTYLREAELNNDSEKINKLKKVYVLSRIVEIKKNDKLKNDIAIYNNCQNPISSRDMVSNREEQIRLNKWLQDKEKPRIFVEIRRGETPKKGSRLYKHQRTTNELLAQLAFTSFLKSPFKAKSKKKTLFNNTNEDIYTLNEDYNSIFNYCKDDSNKGILFKKSKEEINELLFIAYLYKEAKKYLKNNYLDMLSSINIPEMEVNLLNRLLEINNVCLFYNITLYYEFKSQYDSLLKTQNKVFKYEKYYSDKNFKNDLIRKYSTMFLEMTLQIIRDNSGESNISNWVKTQKNEEIFLSKLKRELTLKTDYRYQYKEFVEMFKQ